MSTLKSPGYLRFPLSIGAGGAETSSRLDHVREQIEQVLFTAPGERWFRPEFGVGIRALVFEPNNPPLWELAKKRLLSSLTEALAGEVRPENLSVEIEGVEEKLTISVGFTLDTVNHTERVEFVLQGGG